MRTSAALGVWRFSRGAAPLSLACRSGRGGPGPLSAVLAERESTLARGLRALGWLSAVPSVDGQSAGQPLAFAAPAGDFTFPELSPAMVASTGPKAARALASLGLRLQLTAGCPLCPELSSLFAYSNT
jgi:hypothetical protein